MDKYINGRDIEALISPDMSGSCPDYVHYQEKERTKQR